jgi:large subunit ribosomal protein L3
MPAAKAILGKKLGMTQLFAPDGQVTPVTAIQAGPCPVVQHRTSERDGYVAVQIAFDEKRRQSVKKPEKGHFEKAGTAVRRFVREFRLGAEGDLATYPVGTELKADVFAVGDWVDVVGRSKGKGFAGVVKRHHFKGQSTISHGCHEYERHGGALGGHSDPGRVPKGAKRMAGHMGNARATARNLLVMRVDAAQNLLYVCGAVPGPTNGYVYVRPARTKWGAPSKKQAPPSKTKAVAAPAKKK